MKIGLFFSILFMYLTKLIICSNEAMVSQVASHFSASKVDSNELYTLYISDRQEIEEDQVLILAPVNIEKALKVIAKEYDIFKVLFLWWAKNLGNLDIDDGDIIIPNTFISKQWEGTIFVDYAIWENYDLEKFKIILNGICSGVVPENIDDFYSDVQNQEVFWILQSLEKNDCLKKSVVALVVWEVDNQDENILHVADLILSN